MLLTSLSGKTQSGCTDPGALNFNSQAFTNDGSCTYSVTFQNCRQIGLLTPSVTESSGLAWSGSAMWTLNDSGNSADLFRLDTATGTILQKVSVANHVNTDWEEVTADDSYLYIGDFGNNNGNRTDLKVLRIRKDSIGSAFNASVNADAINFSYTDQQSFAPNSNTNFDCEAMIALGNNLYLFSKNRGDLKTRVYKLPKNPGTYAISPFTGYNVNGEITGASYNATLNEIVLIGYLASKKNSFLWFLNQFPGDSFFSGNKRRVEIGSSQSQWQTEGIAYISDKELMLSCESSDSPAGLYRTAKLFSTPVGFRDPGAGNSEPYIYPQPVTENLVLRNMKEIEAISLCDFSGQFVLTKQLQGGTEETELDLSFLEPGVYVLFLESRDRVYTRKVFVARIR